MKEIILNIIRDNLALNEMIDSTSYLDEISLDSLSFIKTLVMIEEEFNIEFSDEELNYKKYITIDDLVKKVKEKTDEKNGL